MKSTDKRQQLYSDAKDYLIQTVGCVGDFEAYAAVYVDDKDLQKRTGAQVAEQYLSDEIGEFATAEEVVNYLQEEYAIWEDEDLEAVAIRLKWRGDIIQIAGVWYWNM